MIIKKTLLFWVPGVILLSFAASFAVGRWFAEKPTETISAGYQYENKDLGFSLFLPPEFEYFQTQRADSDEIIKLEIFVPTSDLSYVQEVPGYAKPIQIIIGSENDINNLKNDDPEGDKIVIAGQVNGKVYAVKFWLDPPRDWQNKWSENMKDSIIKMIKLY